MRFIKNTLNCSTFSNNVKLFLKIPTMCTVPYHTVRSFLMLNRLKPYYLRCTTRQESLNNLAVVYTNRDAEVDQHKLIKMFVESSTINAR